MALSGSQNNAWFQNKGTNPRQTPRLKRRCRHCGKWRHKKEHCREWLKLTKEQQEQADKESHKRNQGNMYSMLDAITEIRWGIS